jgi:predicted metal-dependent hydrolase
MFIKRKVFKAIQETGRKGLTKQGLLQAIWEAQGRDGEHRLSSGYYGDAIRGWIFSGVVYRPKKGLYKLTKLGKLYTNDAIGFKLAMSRKLVDFLRKRLNEKHNELWRLKRETRDRDNQEIRDLRDRVDDLVYKVDMLKEKNSSLKIQLNNVSPDGVYANDQATYFVMNKQIIMQLNGGGMFKTEDTFMGGAKKKQSLTIQMVEKFEDIYSNLLEY